LAGGSRGAYALAETKTEGRESKNVTHGAAESSDKEDRGERRKTYTGGRGIGRGHFESNGGLLISWRSK